MIRRRTGDSFFLITQHDHALLAGELARQLGNSRFARPAARQLVLDAVAMHDSGWPLHDDAPTLNENAEPLDVFESHRQITFPFWRASVDRAAELGSYVGLLVSLHVLGLSAFVAGLQIERNKGKPFDPSQLADQFEMNKFQHREIERQEHLRPLCGLRTDIPTHLGLADPGTSESEDRLRFDLRVLQAMDQVSLALCCTRPPFEETQEYYPHVGDEPIRFSLRRLGADLLLDPWPFDRSEIVVKIPGKSVPAKAYANETELRDIYGRATTEHIVVAVRAG